MTVGNADARNHWLAGFVLYDIVETMKATNKYLAEHSAKPEDFFLTRRKFLQRAGMGFGALSLAALMGDSLLPTSDLAAAELVNPLSPKSPHFPAKAKHVVHIFAQGAPSHVDTWDPKPMLDKMDGKAIAGANGGVAMASPFTFKKYGKSGIEVSEV